MGRNDKRGYASAGQTEIAAQSDKAGREESGKQKNEEQQPPRSGTDRNCGELTGKD